MLLRSDKGYFARQIKIEDATFGFRELDEAEYKVYLAAMREYLTLGRALYEGLNLPTPEIDPTDLKAASEALAVLRGAAVLEQKSVDQVAAAQVALWHVIDVVVSPGVTTWDLTEHKDEGDAAHGVLRPPHVKQQLSEEILRLTTLQKDERDFASASPKP